VSEMTETAGPSRARTEPVFGVVAISSRPTVQAFFTEIGRQQEPSVAMTSLPLDTCAVAAAFDAVAAADVAVVDASVDRADTIAVCETLRAMRPRLPISAVFCCPHSATSADLRGLLAAGVQALVDLQLSAADTLRVLRGVARGQGAFHLQVAAGSRLTLVELLGDDRGEEVLTDHDLGLLRLVAAGLTDHEIGRQLYLSHHTVKHRIDRLRRRVRARNRIQLAAWAGSQEALRVGRGGLNGAAVRSVDELPAER
jgi:two-component system, NarL family, response regulator DevR